MTDQTTVSPQGRIPQWTPDLRQKYEAFMAAPDANATPVVVFDREDWLRQVDEVTDPAVKQAMLDALDRQDDFLAGYPVAVPPCPQWCGQAAGHRYDDIEGDGVYSRWHDEAQSGWSIAQQEFNHDGVITFGPVAAMDPRAENHCSPDQLRAEAAELVALAVRLEQIQAGA